MNNIARTATTEKTSRRHFLQKSGGLVAASTMVGTLGIARGAHAAGDDTLRVGLIGCGGRGTGAVVNALNADKNAKLTAMADLFPEKLQGSLERLTKIKKDQVDVADDHQFVGFEAGKQLIGTDVDVVLLAAPPHFRPMHLKACVDAGKHVFAEKPVAVDAPGVRSVLASCEEAKKKGLNIVSGLCYRHEPVVVETMKRVQDGAIGDIVAIQETWNMGLASAFRSGNPGATEMERQMRNWYFFTWLSGDHNVEQHVHSLDKASWAMGDVPPAKAWGLGGRQVRVEPKFGNIFDHHAVVYEYDNGVRLYSFCRQQGGCYNDVSDIFLGTKGQCNLMTGKIEGETNWRYRGPKGNRYDIEHEVLFGAIRSGQPVNNGLYMAQSTMIGILGRMADYTGKRIAWDEAIGSEQNLAPSSYSFDADPPIAPLENGYYPIALPGVTKFV